MPKTSTERVRELRARQRQRRQQEGQQRQRGGNRRGAGRPRGTRTAADRNREYRQRAQENRERHIQNNRSLDESMLNVSDVDGNQRSNGQILIESVNAAPDIPDRCNVLNIKEELGDTELDFKPTLHEFDIDIDYISNQPNTSVVKEENTIVDDGEDSILCRIVKQESIKHEWRAAQDSEETMRPQPRLYRCEKCLKTFRWKSCLSLHWRCVHATGSHKCTECNLTYKCAQYLTAHIRDVHSKQQYECAGCKKMCKSKQTLRYHVKRCRELRSADAQRSQPRIYTCDKCLKAYRSINALRMHCRRMHIKGSHECTECNLTYSCADYLTRHIRNMHGKQQYECKNCKKIYKSKHSLRQHLPRCRELRFPERPQPFTCSNCGKNYKTRWYGQKHEKSCKCTRPTASDTSAVASTSTQQHSVVMVKEEPADGELELGPTVFQHMDCNYRPYKLEPQLD